ncbi:MAG TPA: hydroxymethylpyrimidine/phosphomethylpyrimidine kinase [Burkholderiales bacterium]
MSSSPPAPQPASPPTVLTFAASDPTSGAGLQADVLTIAALRCHPLCVLTAVTEQDTAGVARMLNIDAAWITAQARRLLDDLQVAAFKAGVLGSAANARAVASIVATQPAVPFVVDPVLASGRGDTLAGSDTIDALLGHILPRATVLTPNSVEARRLAAPETDLARCARRLVEHGCRYVLITGTHEATDDVRNTLYDKNGVVREDRWPRLPGSYHGSGCTLASAIAAYLALGRPVEQAAADAQQFTWRALQAGFKPGRGQFVPQRFFAS